MTLHRARRSLPLGRSARWRLLFVAVVSAGLIAAVGGCSILGAAVAKLPKPDIAAAYKGLAGQRVGIMIWGDRSTLLVDWPQLPLNLGDSIAYKLKEAQKAEREELKETTFPYPPASFLKFQRENPGMESLPIVDIAPKLQVTRLIYVEINSFSTRVADATTPMLLGQADVSLKVIEVDGSSAKIAFQEDHIRAQFPKSSPPEGEVNGTDAGMYIGALDAISTEVALRFFQHPNDSN